MEYKNVPDLSSYLTDWADEFDLLRQNWLLGESQFLTFAKDRGLPVAGVITGEPGDFSRRAWLHIDGTDSDGQPRFHPFRVYPLRRILQACDLQIARSASLNPDSLLRMTKQMLEWRPPAERLNTLSGDWNNVATLAVILEPIYWPDIIGSQRFSGGIREVDFRRQLQTFRVKVLDLVRSLDSSFWRNVHECLRIDAAWEDDNSHLYMLLRFGAWYEREHLKGAVSGALWIRHMAEVIRRAFEEVHSERWPEEYEAFGYWPAGVRAITFGSERPLDDPLAGKSYLAHTFGLFTGCVARWYLEGDTEYFTVVEMIPEISRFGVELVNLGGAIATGKGNTPLKLEALLQEDRSVRRLSVLSFDGEVPTNLKYIRRQVGQGNIVGLITVHDPDFEFANFSTSELADVAAMVDDTLGFSGDAVRKANWSGVQNARAFEQKYLKVSNRKPSALKGEGWGRALARYAREHPDRPDGVRRPLWEELRAAVQGWSVNYDLHRDRYTFDLKTFGLIKKPKAITS
jgi:hypothetical protein